MVFQFQGWLVTTNFTIPPLLHNHTSPHLISPPLSVKIKYDNSLQSFCFHALLIAEIGRNMASEMNRLEVICEEQKENLVGSLSSVSAIRNKSRYNY